MSRIFLSHSSRNNAAALALAGWLHDQGWADYFLDVSENRGIAPGERWMSALAGAVDRCEAVIFLVSPAWRDSKFCFAEFYQAKNLGKRIFGVIVEPIALSQLPEQLTAEWQVCDLTHAQDTVAFTVERAPLVPRTVVRFPAFGLEALARGLRKAGLDPSNFVWPPEEDPGRSPYPGLRALDEPDAAVFFGREASIVRAINQIRLVRERDIERLFVILGASGAGKSSFLRAGLLPRLRRDSDHFVVLPPIRPERAAMSGSQGLLACLKAALTLAGQAMSQAELRAELEGTGLVGVLGRIESLPQASDLTRQASPHTGARTLVVPIDQAEELFASDGGDEAQQLLRHIEALVQDLAARGLPSESARLRVLFVVTIRSDSLPRLQAHATLHRLSPVLFSLPAMPASEFKSVIEGPARRHTETVKPLTVSPQLTEELVADAKGGDALPLLALTLEWLYREFTTPQGTRIGHDEYTRLGGVRGVIGMAVERALEQPGREPAIPMQRTEQERLLEQLFPFIATVDPDSGEWKRRVALRETLRAAVPQADAMVQRLVEQRLLVADSRQMAQAVEPVEVVEVAHEALLRQWDTLERWLRTFAADLAAAESIRRAATDWQRGERDDALLVHTAHRLQAAQALIADDRFKGRFESVDAQYLGACGERNRRELQAREDQMRQMAEQQTRLTEQQAKRAVLQRRATWGLALALGVTLALVAWIVQQTRELGRKTSLVYASSAEAATNRGEADRGVRLAILATRATWLHPADATARPALATASDSNALRLLLSGHSAQVRSVSFSPDGRRVVTASSDGSARLWDAETGEPLGMPMNHHTTGELGVVMKWPLVSASFSPDGQRVLTAASDRTARLWDAESGRPVGEPMKHKDEITSASFSLDGKRVITSSLDRTARVWNVENGQPLGEPMKHEDQVAFAAFSPDGRRVVTKSGTASRQGQRWTVRVWAAGSGTPVGAPMNHRAGISSLSFSPDGKRIVIASRDDTVRIWDSETGMPLGAPMKPEGAVGSTSFSPDGKPLVTASRDRTASVWDAETGKRLGELMKHEDVVSSASLSPDGKRVVTVSEGNTVRIWDLMTGQRLGAPMVHHGEYTSATFSPDGKRFATWSDDGTVRLWDAETGTYSRLPMTDVGFVRSAEFSPDGRHVVTASEDKAVRVWEVTTGKLLFPPMTHVGPVSSASFTLDGKLVATTSEGNTARIWDAKTGQPLGVPLTLAGSVGTASFSPDGKRVATALLNGTFQVWDITTGKPLGAPISKGQPVQVARFSPDGKRIVTESFGGDAQLWDAEAGMLLGALMKQHGDEEVVTSASFSSDGRRVVTTSMDKTARLWDAITGKPVGAPMQHENPVYSASFSRDGKRLVTVTINAARLWDSETGKPLSAPMTHAISAESKPTTPGGWIMSAGFSPDGRTVVTISDEGTVRIWRADWSLFESPEALVATACARMNPAARRITVEDQRLVPLVPPQMIGQDVCEAAGLAPSGRR